MQLLRPYQSNQIPQTMQAIMQVIPYSDEIYASRKGRLHTSNHEPSRISVLIMEGTLVASPRIMSSR